MANSIKLLALVAVIALLFNYIGDNMPDNNPGDVYLLPPVEAFLGRHPEFGKAKDSEQIPDWKYGRRQRVWVDTGRGLLFYTKSGEVVSVYEDYSDGSRKKVWGTDDA